ncbi:5-hydroxytryptamine receptor 3A-like isoform X3 [Syngnathoides biaculeatus]|uniref:5-hydroxytryptamine receptor 3A-like isoform X3 n=1 Tax=Syngnathoides biaculeatus TaxID=300417 RepID=UPI002ADE20E6|nr:5-hydroxytryptamine receptor 3A-like isoform X3 [Syngnathoides biaculeatus]
MKVPLIVLILSGVGGAPPGKVCSYQDVVDHLNLTSSNRAFHLTRPVLDHTRATLVELNMILYAIVGVIEKTQTFIPFLWTITSWTDERIFWDPDEFCGITEISLPTDLLWIPDIFIFEMVEKDNSQHNPYLLVKHDGTVLLDQDIRAVSVCMMDVHKFPFDTQRCNISLASAVFKYEQLRVIPVVNSSRATESTKALLHSQGEWEFLHLSVSSGNISFDDLVWDKLVYTFVIKRRPLLHVINFLLPILFFLCLDLASYFIPEHHGEKLGFKVTVLLAISVLLLILNDILPSTSNRTPLIATYCIVIFALMLLSLLETITVAYLTEGRSSEKLACCGRGKREKDPTDEADSEEIRQTDGCASSKEKPQKLLPALPEFYSNREEKKTSPGSSLLLHHKGHQGRVQVLIRGLHHVHSLCRLPPDPACHCRCRLCVGVGRLQLPGCLEPPGPEPKQRAFLHDAARQELQEADSRVPGGAAVRHP